MSKYPEDLSLFSEAGVFRGLALMFLTGLGAGLVLGAWLL